MEMSAAWLMYSPGSLEDTASLPSGAFRMVNNVSVLSILLLMLII